MSVVLITHGRLALLEACLASLESCDPPRPREILLVINGHDPALRAWAEEKTRFNPSLRVFELTAASKSRARNLAVRAALGEWIYFLDDDVTVSPDLFRCLAEKIRRHPEAQVWGGPNRTPPVSAPFQKAAGFALESWWGAGRMSRRYRPVDRDAPADDRALMLCNLAVRRTAFRSRDISFDERFYYNEENMLLDGLRREKTALWASPDLVVYHARRSDAGSYFRQVWHSGVGRGHMTRVRPASLRWDFAGPPVWLLYVLSLAAFPFGFFFVPLAAYAAGTTAEMVRCAALHGAGGALRVGGLLAGGHLVYGAGFWAGLFFPSLNAPREK